MSFDAVVNAAVSVMFVTVWALAARFVAADRNH
jgi:hypothetical protein